MAKYLIGNKLYDLKAKVVQILIIYKKKIWQELFYFQYNIRPVSFKGWTSL